MKVSVLQVKRCKPILGLDAFDHAPMRQYFELDPVQGPVQDSQIQGWSKTTAFLEYNEVRAVKPLPHLDWRDRLDSILCQEDSLENTAELWRSPGELNRVAELNCAREPIRRAGQHEPCLQTPCKWLQQHNWHTRGGAVKGNRAGRYRRQRVLRHPRRTPWIPEVTGQRCVGRHCVPEPHFLGRWQDGSWARVRRQHIAPISLGCPCQGCLIDFLDNLGTGWDAGGAALLREARRACLGVYLAWGGAALEDAGGHPRRRADRGLVPGAAVADGASRRGRMFWIASVCFCTVEDSWAKPSRKHALLISFISARLSQRWHSWATMVDIAFPKAMTFVARRANSVAVRSSCITPGLELPLCICLSTLTWCTCRIAMACTAEAA